MAFLSSWKLVNPKASMSRKESWHLKASKLREKAGGVGDRGIASTTMMIAMSAMDKTTPYKCTVAMLLFVKASEGTPVTASQPDPTKW